MACGYKRRDRQFEAEIAKRADELRAKREAKQVLEIVRSVQGELLPWLILSEQKGVAC